LGEPGGQRIASCLSEAIIGSPRIAVVTSVVALETSFIHFAERMSSTTWVLPACANSSATSPSRPAVASLRLPTANQEFSGAVCLSTTPGSSIIAEHSITQPIARSGPTTSEITSAVKPFCTPARRPPSASTGLISSADHLVS
jgi:hypothetical protein